MPKPVFCLCSLGMSVDKGTNLVSYFTVVERLSLGLPREPSDQPMMLESPGQSLLVTAVWRRNVNEAGKTFRHRLKYVDPNGDEFPLSTGTVQYAEATPEKYLARLVTPVPGIPTNGKPADGLARFVSEMRQTPEPDASEFRSVDEVFADYGDDWESASYPVWVTLKVPEPEADQPSEPIKAE